MGCIGEKEVTGIACFRPKVQWKCHLARTSYRNFSLYSPHLTDAAKGSLCCPFSHSRVPRLFAMRHAEWLALSWSGVSARHCQKSHGCWREAVLSPPVPPSQVQRTSCGQIFNFPHSPAVVAFFACLALLPRRREPVVPCVARGVSVAKPCKLLCTLLSLGPRSLRFPCGSTAEYFSSWHGLKLQQELLITSPMGIELQVKFSCLIVTIRNSSPQNSC